MSNQRKATKKQVGFYAEPDEREALRRLAIDLGFNDVTTLLRAIARGELQIDKPKPPPTTRGG